MLNKTVVKIRGKSVIITNDGDNRYEHEVKNWLELNEVISELKKAGREVFGIDYSDSDFDE